MAVATYRVCRRIYARLDGEGSRRVGGRWNSHVIVETIRPDHVRILAQIQFLDFNCSETMRERSAGDDWIASGESALLRVPSAVVRGSGIT